ncbi:hypothetical protein MMC24_004326 [Lignoscripta atroalba]|nr:hypothetical protein [Lignoscripta atroalba]
MLPTTMQPSETALNYHDGPTSQRGRQLPPIQTSFNSKPPQRLQRPRPVERTIYEKPAECAFTAEVPPLKRRTSKGGLLGLFGRNKSTKENTHNIHLDGMKEEHDYGDKLGAKGASFYYKTVRSTVTLEDKVVPTAATKPPSSLQHKSSESTPRSRSIKKERTPRSLTTWDPPPLFQAYPQAVKYADLAALTLPAETVLRNNNHRRSSSKRRGSTQTAVDVDSTECCVDNENGDNNDGKHTRRPSGSGPKADWTHKIYVLVTSGFLLQYAGEGSFDRLPEKIMRLGKDSAAFASDAIPGKHWVLQISQATDDDGKITTGITKSVFSKLGFWGDMKRSAFCFLLVLDSPEEMDLWLVAVRKEIEALGGKKYQPDIGIQKAPEEVIRHLRDRPSRRYLVQRDPNQFSTTQPHAEPLREVSFGDVVNDEAFIRPSGETLSLRSAKRQSLATRPSMDAPSTSTTAISSDQACLERLRESCSVASAQGLTISRASSTLPSPTNSGFRLDAPSSNTNDLQMPTDKTRRKSMQTLRMPVNVERKSLDLRPAPKSPRPHSTYGSSPSTPNFSVPSFSKRYSSNALPSMPVSQLPTATAYRTPSPRAEVGKEDPSERPMSVIGELPSTTRISPKTSRTRISVNPVPLQPSTLKSIRPSTSQTHLPSFGSDRPVPRRFSSQEYTYGKLPPTPQRHIQAPHPPPTTALPAVPGISSWHSQSQPTRSSSTPAISSQKLRRPASMQVRSDPIPRIKPVPSQARAATMSSNKPASIPLPVVARQPPRTPAQPLQQVSETETPPQMRVPEIAGSAPLRVSSPPTSVPIIPPPTSVPIIPPILISASTPEMASSGWPDFSMYGTERRSFQSVRVS